MTSNCTHEMAKMVRSVLQFEANIERDEDSRRISVGKDLKHFRGRKREQ